MASGPRAAFESEAAAGLCGRITRYLSRGASPMLIAITVESDGENALVAADYINANVAHMVMGSVYLPRLAAHRLGECTCGDDHARELAGLRAAASELERLYGLRQNADLPPPSHLAWH